MISTDSTSAVESRYTENKTTINFKVVSDIRVIHLLIIMNIFSTQDKGKIIWIFLTSLWVAQRGLWLFFVTNLQLQEQKISTASFKNFKYNKKTVELQLYALTTLGRAITEKETRSLNTYRSL